MNIFQRVSRKESNRIAYEETNGVYELFHEASKINAENFRALSRHIGKLVEKDFFLKLMSRSYKTYPTSDSTSLPYAFDDTPASKSLREVVIKRRSIREFSGNAISLNNLASIIFNAYGLTAKSPLKPGIEHRFRAVPSGGALYPLELYVASLNVTDLPPGIYHYNVAAHSLEAVKEGSFRAALTQATFTENLFDSASAAFLITGRIRRSFIKYGERAYRFMMLEAGHVGQNICLSSFALDLGCLMIGGFFDDDMDEIVGADGVSETMLYAGAVGRLD